MLRRNDPIPAGLRAPPLLPGGYPLVGHTVEFVRNTIGLLERARRELGEVAAVDVAGRRMVAFFGPEAHEAIFRAKDAVLDPREAYQIMTPVFGEGLVYDAPHDIMAEQFKMLLPALKDGRMRTYGETILDEVSQSIEGWGDAGELDVVDYCRVLTNYTSSHCLLGSEFRSGMTEEFARIYHDLEQGVTPLAYIDAHLPIPSFRKRDKARTRLVELIGGIIEARLASGREGEDFLQTLMEARYKSGRPLTHDEITGMLLAAMFAGHHTSSVATAWTLIELCRHPDYLRRVIEELDGTYGEDGTTSYQTLRSIPITENAVKEALRLYPPLFMLIRVAVKDFVYKDYHLPAGSWLVISPTVSHRMSEHFAHPLAFDPDRFAPPRSEGDDPWAFIAFGGGRHKCMGNAFALLQVKAILATLLRRYEFELVTEDVRPNFHGLVIGPSEPCKLRYRRRAIVEARRAPAVSVPEALAPQAVPPQTVAAQAPLLRITLDRDLCQGHAVCIEEAPEVFTLADDGKVALLTDTPAPEHHAAVREAARYCPQKTILLHEAPAAAQASGCPFH
ncbi:MAG: cytochrome P450 [Sandaracinaceae bacterium]|nr:cytochrome P450 [Sandaracinaceae bacterium]